MVTDMNNTLDTVVKSITQGINDKVFCNLVDLGFDPGQAYEASHLTDFDLSKDVEEFPVTEELDEDIIYDSEYVVGR